MINTIFMKKLLFICLTLFISQIAMSQVEVVISETMEDADGNASIEVRVNNFTDITGMQFSLNWDDNIFSVYQANITNISSDLPQFDITDFATSENIEIDEGELAVQWSLSSTQTVSLPDNHLLFTIEPNINAGNCEDTEILMTDEPRQIEFSSETTIVDAVSVDGSFETYCPQGVILTINNEIASSGEQVCVPVTVQGFQDMLVAQFNISYPPTLLDFDMDASSSVLPGAVILDNANDNKVIFLWTDGTPETPETLADGSTILELCFDVIGASGNTANLLFLNDADNDIDFQNGDDESVPATLNNGSVSILGNANDFTLYFDDTELIKNQTSCVTIKANNINDILTMQFGLTWDDDNLDFASVGNFNADLNITSDAINVDGNLLVLTTFDQTTLGWNYPDGTHLFDICFESVGDCDESTWMEFTGEFDQNGIEISDTSGEPIPFFLDEGDLTIICPCVVTDIEITPVTCFGDSDGAISFSVEGATGDFTCEWTPSSITDCAPTGLESGNYTVTITDEANCTSTATFSVGSPAEIEITYTTTDEVDGCDGEIDVTTDGGNSGAGEYDWSNNETTEDLTDLCKGEYTLTYTDSKYCMAVSDPIMINPKDLEIDDFTVVDNPCFDGELGSISLEVSGGCPDYTFEWEREGGGVTLPNNPSITNLPAGTYNVTITDESTPPMELVQSYEILQTGTEIIITVDNIVPSDGSSGSVDVTVTGGDEPYDYNWIPGNLDTEDISGLPGGKFVLEVTDANGCVVTSDTIVVGSSYIEWDSNITNASCAGACDGVIGGQFIVSNGDVTVFLDGDAIEFPILDLCAGEYELLFVDENDIQLTETVNVGEPTELEGTFIDQSDCSNGDDGEATVDMIGGTEPYSYEWGNGEDMETAFNLPDGETTVLVTDANGCQYMLSIAMNSCDTTNTGCFESNNIITPNNDGKNDFLVITCLGGGDNHLYIFNRYGDQVYDQNNYDNMWSGTSNNGRNLDQDGYMWVLEVISGDGARNIYKGSVTLLR